MTNKQKFVYGDAIDRAFTEPAFLERLIKTPISALAETGVKVDDGVNINVSMVGNSAGGALSIDVQNASVDWHGSVNITLHK